MDKKKLDIKHIKDIAEDAGHVAIGLGIMAGEKAKPVAEKIGKGIKGLGKKDTKKDGESDEVKIEEVKESQDTDNEFDASKTLNSVIEGAYYECTISDKKGVLFVGDKEVSHSNCESYEIKFENEVVDKTKAAFAEYRKHCINPVIKFSSEKYITIVWRNSEKSVACVDSSKYDQIIKLLS